MDEVRKLIDKYYETILATVLEHGLRIIGIVVLVAVLLALLSFGRRVFQRYYLRRQDDGGEKFKRAQTLGRVVSVLGWIIILTSGLMMVVDEVGIDVKPLIASIGIGGVALGFGAQSLVKDIISGFFILMEDQIREGDVVQTAGQGGLVESVGLRALVLRDLAGNRIVIPNSRIDVVVNMTYEYSRYVFDIGVAYKEDTDKVIEVIKRVADELCQDEKFKRSILEPIEVLGVDKFADSAVVIKARFKTKPIKQWEVAREYNRRLKMAFDREGIEIPFPHRTLYFGQPEWSKPGVIPPPAA